MFVLNRLTAAALFICLVFLVTAAGAEQEQPRTFPRVITESPAEYVIEVSGTIDPENVEIAIENLGETPVTDPRITVNDLYDWYDINSMVEEITADCTTDEEKALAIWQWVHWKRFQRSPHDESSLNPVRDMNCYGYGICGHTSAWIKGLATAAGLKARIFEISGHTISEVYYNGDWHMLDGNVKVFYLGRDNRTIASLAELEQDPWLIERTIHPRDPWVRQDDPPGRNQQFVRYIITTRDNLEGDHYDPEIFKDYSMSYTLKQGEKLIRWWNPRLGKFEGRDKNPLVPQRYANGRLIWEPDLEKTDLFEYIEVIRNVTTRQQDGRGPAIHVEHLQDELYPRPASFVLPIYSPYPVVGGRFWCRLVKEDDSGTAAVSFGHPWKGGTSDLYNFRRGSGTQDIELDLDLSILKASPLYTYYLCFSLKGRAKTDPPKQAGVDWFKSVSDLQVSPHSLPALSLGRNVIRYRDSGSPGPRKVRITYTWRKISDNHAPGKVSEAVYPPISGEIKTLSPTLKWRPASDQDPGDSVADYQVMVSLRPDCRWPVSPTLYQNIGSDECQWKVPESFLNPGTAYYWRVRARDSREVIGLWGETFSFKTSSRAK